MMAKLKRGFTQISGKYGDAVFVNSKKYGYHIRRAPEAGLKKDEPMLALQYGRTKFLNILAGELNKLMTVYFPQFKSAGFYHTLQKHFRKEPLNNRFLLLRQLKGLDLNPAYPMAKLGRCSITTKVLKRRMQVQLQVDQHPPQGRYAADCYYYELALFCWDKSGGPAQADWQLSNWVPIDGGRPVFDFSFTVPQGTQHWLLCLRQQLGIGQQDLAYYAAHAVQIWEVGSFDKADMAILDTRKLEAAARTTTKVPRKALQEMGRVEAVRYL
jgi:hypothetical protein